MYTGGYSQECCAIYRRPYIKRILDGKFPHNFSVSWGTTSSTRHGQDGVNDENKTIEEIEDSSAL